MLLGDVVHCAVELLDDEWAGVADVDPKLAQQTRNVLARELEGSTTPVAAAHFPGLAFGRVLAGEGTRRFVFQGASVSEPGIPASSERPRHDGSERERAGYPGE